MNASATSAIVENPSGAKPAGRAAAEPGLCDTCVRRIAASVLVDVSRELQAPLESLIESLQELENGRCGALPSEASRRVAIIRRTTMRALDMLGQMTGSAAAADALPLAGQVAATADDREFLLCVSLAIEERLDREEFNVAALAACLAMDRSHLFRRLRRLTGLSPSALIRELRLERAAGRLAAGTANVGEIAWSVGFKDVSHFTKCFRARFSATPSTMCRSRPETSRRQEG